MSAADESLSLIFRCPAELEGLLPPPVPAGAGLPEWLRTMPAEAVMALDGSAQDTVKRCPPVVDAMTAGFLIPLICDVRVEAGEFSWDAELPARSAVAYPRSPLGLHDPSQVTGTPLHDPDRFLIKFHNLWTIEAPPGWSVLITHPVNRFDLPFTTLTGLVDCDRFHETWVHFPAHWNDPGFIGVLPKGTPVAQCFPVKRERWAVRTEAMGEAHAQAAHETLDEIRRARGIYRRRARAS